MTWTSYAITPVPAPRMVRSDRWRKRAPVLRYFAFRDEVRRLKMVLPEHPHIVFVMPFPKSYSAANWKRLMGQPHVIRPDTDNLAKAVLDSVYKDDAHVYDLRATKIWGETGCIFITEMEKPLGWC